MKGKLNSSNHLSPRQEIERLYREYKDKMKIAVLPIVRDPELIEDLAHEVFYKILKKVEDGSILQIDNLRAYMIQTMRNLARNHVRNLSNRKKIQAGISNSFEWNSRREYEGFDVIYVQEVLDHIPNLFDREIFGMQLDGYKLGEIALRMSKSKATISRHLLETRQFLQTIY